MMSGVHGPPMLLLDPGADGGIIGFSGVRIAQNMGVQIFLQSSYDFRRIFEFHVGHGEGDDARGQVGFLFPHAVPFSGSASGTVDQGFKIILHRVIPQKQDDNTGNVTGFAEIIIVLFFWVCQQPSELCAVLEILLAEGSPAVPPKEKEGRFHWK